MKPLKERLVSEGNAFYEIDLECLKKKGEKKKEKNGNMGGVGNLFGVMYFCGMGPVELNGDAVRDPYRKAGQSSPHCAIKRSA